jgi:hypothetical protein
MATFTQAIEIIAVGIGGPLFAAFMNGVGFTRRPMTRYVRPIEFTLYRGLPPQPGRLRICSGQLPENGKKTRGNAEELTWETGNLQVSSGYA